MWKKLVCWSLLLLLLCPLPANANLADDVKQFQQKYADIYSSIDPALMQKMETFLQDVVDYVVVNYSTTKSVDVQIKNAIGSVLLTGDTYKNDLLPFLMDQAANKELYASQLREMQAIVRNEVQNRLNAQSPTTPGGGGGGITPNLPSSSADTEINSQISQGKLNITILFKNSQESLDISGASLQKITTGNTLKIQGTGITLIVQGDTLNLPASDVWKVQLKQISPRESDPLIKNLPAHNKIIGTVHELKNVVNNSPMQTNFAKPVRIEIHYNESELQGVTEDSLDVYYYNEAIPRWEKMNGTIDKANNTITFTTSHFSKYAIMGAAATAEPPINTAPPATHFTDLTGHWAKDNISKLVSSQAVNGYPDGSFRPNNTITRAEFATILVKAFNLTPKSGKVFTDTANHWAKDYIATANAYGIINGCSDSIFAPDDLITREEMAVMVVKAANLKKTGSGKIFADSESISFWAKEYVDIASQYALISGYPDNTYRPSGTATRAEAVTVIIKAVPVS